MRFIVARSFSLSFIYAAQAHVAGRLRPIWRLLSVTAACVLLIACSESKDQTIKKETVASLSDSKARQALVSAFAKSGHDCFSGVANHALTLHQSIQAFVDDVTQKHWQTAQLQWQQAEFLWRKCALYLAVGEHYSKDIKQKQYRVAYWPIFAGYIDYVPEYPHAGLVYDTMLPMTQETLLSQHQVYSNDQASVGLYVLGVLLGNVSEKKLSDYQPLKNVLKPVEEHQDIVQRRLDYLQLAAELWLEDVGRYVSAWMGDSNRALDFRRLANALVSASMQALEQKQLSHSVQLDDAKLHSTLFKGLLGFIGASKEEASASLLNALVHLPAAEREHYRYTVQQLRASMAPNAPWGLVEQQAQFIQSMAQLKKLLR